jgi:two-component system sensor histidine kinase UhpB
VFRQALSIDDFGSDETIHFAGDEVERVATKEDIGEVRVFLSKEPARVKQERRIISQLVLLLVVGSTSIWVATLLGKALHRPMNTAIRALREIRGGDYVVKLEVDDGGEMGELLDAINEMSSSLDEAKRHLEEKVKARTRDLEASMDELKKSDAEKRRLIQKVDSAVEDERKSIAVEIHDELNAALLGARYSSRRILDMAAALPAGNEAKVIKESADSIINVTSALYTSARKIVRRLRPEVLDMLGLEGAVEEMLQTYEAAPGAPAFTFQSSGDFARVDGTLAIAAYRLIQECVSNVVKHAGATQGIVMAQVRDAAEEQQLRLAVVDDGVGFDPQSVQEGIGLIGMKERVYAFGGVLTLKTGPGAGTRVEIQLPLSAGADSAA